MKQGVAVMKCTEPGVLAGSDYYFTTPSVMAKNLFYYILCVGSYSCTAGYHIKRKRYNSMLLMYLLEGSCTVCCGGKTGTAQAGDVVLLNCYQPHEYYTDSNLKILWLHFDGAQSLELAEHIIKTQGTVFPCRNPALFEGSLTAMVEIFRKGQTVSEPSVSCMIYTLLCNLVTETSVTGSMELDEGVVSDAVRFMKENLKESLTVEQISRSVNVSPSHFSRLFKKQTGSSPYEFVIKVRIDAAKKLLKNSGFSVAEIAAQTGFNSQSNFIYTFHAKVGISPKQFRNTPF